jgi:hypothetical protein
MNFYNAAHGILIFFKELFVMSCKFLPSFPACVMQSGSVAPLLQLHRLQLFSAAKKRCSHQMKNC